MAAVYLGGNTVPAIVVIVVKHRACLLVGRLIEVRLFSWQVAVRYQQQGCLGGSTMLATGSYSVGKLTRNLVSRLQAYQYDYYLIYRLLAYWHNQYRNSRHSGAISLLIIYGSTVPVQGRFRRQISTESYYRVSSVGRLVQSLVSLYLQAYQYKFLSKFPFIFFG